MKKRKRTLIYILYVNPQFRCAPCKAFTPMLAAAYPQLQQQSLSSESSSSSSCEVLFVSHDTNASAFKEYRKSMPWPSLPFEMHGRRLRADLATSLGIQSLPSLVILDTETGEVCVSVTECV